MSENQFCELSTLTMDACTLTHEARDEARRTWMCRECVTARPETHAIDVVLQGRRPADRPFNFVYAGMIPLVHRELLDLFGQENVARDLYLGCVFDERGKELDEWFTAKGRRQLIVRGSVDAKIRVCSGCNRNLYSASGKSFLCPAPSPDATIYQTDVCGFIVPREIAERVREKRWRRVRIEPLPILDPPPDGFGELEIVAGRSLPDSSD